MKAELTRMALAQLAGCGQTIALEIENRQRVPATDTLLRLALVLDVSASWLAFGMGDQQAPNISQAQTALGDRLRLARTDCSMSLAELGRRTGRSPRAIAKIENGGQSGIDVIESLAKALGVSAGWLAFGIEPRVVASPRRGRPPAQPASVTAAT
jgi:transcriptional regulator with XRE-family HTH domain